MKNVGGAWVYNQINLGQIVNPTVTNKYKLLFETSLQTKTYTTVVGEAQT